MTALNAIILQTIRAAFREKVVLCLLILLFLVLGVLPSQLRGDGTAEGRIQLLLRYGTGLSILLLSLTSVWMACASISGEMKNKHLFMVLSKSVSRTRLWLGKWIGLMLIQGMLCAVCGIAVTLQVELLLHSEPIPEQELARLREEVLTARTRLQPVLPDVTELARQRMEAQRQAGQLPIGRPDSALLQDLVNYLRLHQYAVQPGESREWSIALDRPMEAGEVLHFATRLDGASMSHRKHLADWIIRAHDKEIAKIPLATREGNLVRFRLNEDNALVGATRVDIELQNKHLERNVIFLDTDAGLNLYRPADGFAENVLRTMLITWSLLSVLTAIGLSAGAVFSFPVAVYLTSFFLLLHFSRGLVSETAERGSILNRQVDDSAVIVAFDELGNVVFKAIEFLVKPVQSGVPLRDLAAGTAISWERVITNYGQHMLPALLVIGVLGILGFRKREVGAAS